MNAYTRPLLRFWWVLLLGLAVAAVAGILVVDHVKLGLPPKLKTRSTPQYQAEAQFLVDTKDGFIFRTKLHQVTPQPPKSTRICTRDSSGASHCRNVPVQQPAQVQTVSPDLGLLVKDANLFPSLVESTPFLAYRDQRFPHLAKKATLTATALGATRSGGRIHASPVPIDVIDVTAKSPKRALDMANATLTAFTEWVVAQQKASGIPEAERVVIRPLVQPTKAANITSSTKTLAGLVFVLVLALFVALVYVFERSFPRRPQTRPVGPMPGGREHELDDLAGLETEIRRARTSDTPA